MNQEWRDAKVLFRFNGVPVKVRPSFWPMWLSSWPVLIWLAKWRRPKRSWPKCVLIGTVSLPFPLIADLGHALAHTVSAKAAWADMDEIRLAADMPRTIYFYNDVSPDQHRLRATGGPIFSSLGLLLSLLWHWVSKTGSTSRELAEISCVSHGFILFGSLMPISLVDGGTLLKWTLIDNGWDPIEADKQVRQTGIGSVIIAAVAAFGFLLKWLAGRSKHD